jgi:hypothetical protein
MKDEVRNNPNQQGMGSGQLRVIKFFDTQAISNFIIGATPKA